MHFVTSRPRRRPDHRPGCRAGAGGRHCGDARRRASCARNTGSTRWSCAGSPRAASRLPAGRVDDQRRAPGATLLFSTDPWFAIKARDFQRGTDMADAQDDFPPTCRPTSRSASSCCFTILFIVLLLACMALGLVGNVAHLRPAARHRRHCGPAGGLRRPGLTPTPTDRKAARRAAFSCPTRRSADDLGAGEEVGDLDRGILRRDPEPCTELASIDSAKSLRMVPAAALAGLVAPMTSRFLAMASSPSSTCTTTGPEVMKVQRSLKNGRALCTP